MSRAIQLIVDGFVRAMDRQALKIYGHAGSDCLLI
jgi:hypothetical protein